MTPDPQKTQHEVEAALLCALMMMLEESRIRGYDFYCINAITDRIAFAKERSTMPKTMRDNAGWLSPEQYNKAVGRNL